MNGGGTNSTIKIGYINSTTLTNPPISSFVMNKTSGVPPLGVSFNDTSAYAPNSWNWSFGDGTFNESKNTSHLYSSEGVYYIKLNVSNAYGFNTSQQTLYVVNTTIGGGTSSSSQQTSWIDMNIILVILVMGIPGIGITIYLISRRNSEY